MFEVSVSVEGYRQRVYCFLSVLDTSVDEISVSPISVSTYELQIDQSLSGAALNAVTMEHFFGGSIAAIREVWPPKSTKLMPILLGSSGPYRTAAGQRIPVSLTVDPAVFEPLLEWRINGQAKYLGMLSSLSFSAGGPHTVSVGHPTRAQDIEIETYKVTITSHISRVDLVPEGEPITFTAVTDPPGYEDEITWLSSTKYGTATPVMGSGPTFTVQFDDTWGPRPRGGLLQWLGVRADSVVFNQDQKGCQDNSECDDGDPCTTDTCVDKACQNVQSDPCCGDPDPCCGNPDPCCGVNCPTCQVCSTGTCVPGLDGSPCPDDGDPCTDDLCMGGTCTHTDNGTCAECQIQSVEWVGVDPGDGSTNLEATALHGGGMRLFPGKNTMGPTGKTHRKVKCKATLTAAVPAEQTVTLYFKIFDVDDPTRNGAGNPIDPNDTATTFVSGDNRPHFFDGSGLVGMTPGGIVTRVITATNNSAEVEYEVTQVNPGNNWKVFVSCSQTEIKDIEVNTAVENGKDEVNSFKRTSSGAIPPANQQSPLLSVWRKLHVEVDSMRAEFVIGISTNLEPTILEDFGETWVADQFNRFGEAGMWKVNPDTFQSTTFTVEDTLTGESRVTVGAENDMTQVAQTGNFYAIEFTGFSEDDDDLFRGDIPDPDTTAFSAAFEPCYIAPLLTVDNPDAPWHYNFNPSEVTGFSGNTGDYLEEQRGNVLPGEWDSENLEDDDYWTVYCMGAYDNGQGIGQFDNDPNWESGSAGVTRGIEPEGSFYFREVVRDYAVQHGWNAGEITNELRGVVLHEVAHQFGLGHPPEGEDPPAQHVMWVAADAQENLYGTRLLVFKDADIHIIRSIGTSLVGNGQHP